MALQCTYILCECVSTGGALTRLCLFPQISIAVVCWAPERVTAQACHKACWSAARRQRSGASHAWWWKAACHWSAGTTRDTSGSSPTAIPQQNKVTPSQPRKKAYDHMSTKCVCFSCVSTCKSPSLRIHVREDQRDLVIHDNPFPRDDDIMIFPSCYVLILPQSKIVLLAFEKRRPEIS